MHKINRTNTTASIICIDFLEIRCRWEEVVELAGVVEFVIIVDVEESMN